jgi:hypothetical protein
MNNDLNIFNFASILVIIKTYLGLRNDAWIPWK